VKPTRSLRPLLLVLSLAVLALCVREPRAEAWGGGSPTWVGGPFIPAPGAVGQCLVDVGGVWTSAPCGTLPSTPASNAIWFIDPANSTGCAADTNNGSTNTCGGAGVGPLLTFQQLNTNRWGCGGNPRACPRLRVNTVITFLSSHTTNADPVILYPSLEAGASLIVSGTQLGNTSGTLTVVTAKNRATGQLLASTTSIGAFPAGALVVNSTHSSHAWTYASGSPEKFTQPLAPSSVPYATMTTFPAEVDTWAAADSITISTAQSGVDIVDVRPIIADFNVGDTNGVYLTGLTVFDPAGVALDGVYIGPHVYASDVRFDRSPFIVEATQFDVFGFWYNCYFDSGWYGGSVGRSYMLVGGVATGSGGTFNPSSGVAFDGDFIYNPTISTMRGGAFGTFYIETGRTLSILNEQAYVGPNAGFGYATAAIWGPGALNIGGNGRLSYVTPATSTFLLTGAMTLNGNAGAAGTPILCNTAAAPQTLVQGANTSGFTLTPAHLSAACGTGGFGDRAFNFGQASLIGSLL
jgi:hypothetical protein